MEKIIQLLKQSKIKHALEETDNIVMNMPSNHKRNDFQQELILFHYKFNTYQKSLDSASIDFEQFMIYNSKCLKSFLNLLVEIEKTNNT